MADMTELEARCQIKARAANDKHCERYAAARSADEWQINAIVRAVLSEAGAVGETEIVYEVWQGNIVQASTSIEADARYFLESYGNLGPVELVRDVTYRQKVQP